MHEGYTNVVMPKLNFDVCLTHYYDILTEI